MCGRGVILVEAARHWPDATYLGVDVDMEQV
jgi:tRNA G46 methylase TrmB